MADKTVGTKVEKKVSVRRFPGERQRTVLVKEDNRISVTLSPSNGTGAYNVNVRKRLAGTKKDTVVSERFATIAEAKARVDVLLKGAAGKGWKAKARTTSEELF